MNDPMMTDVFPSCHLMMNDLIDELKRKERIQANQMLQVQNHISNNNRFVLFRWIMDVLEMYSYSPSTTHICIAYADRFLSLQSIPLANLQLLGAACIFLTAKMEEESVPEVSQLNELTDFSYSNEAIIEMEKTVLNKLGWSLVTATSFHFLGHFSSFLCDSDLQLHARKHYEAYNERARDFAIQLCQSSLLDSTFLQYYPSLVAAGCVMAARRMTPVIELWPEHMEQLTGYPQEEAFFLSSLLLELCQEEEEDIANTAGANIAAPVLVQQI